MASDECNAQGAQLFHVNGSYQHYRTKLAAPLLSPIETKGRPQTNAKPCDVAGKLSEWCVRSPERSTYGSWRQWATAEPEIKFFGRQLRSPDVSIEGCAVIPVASRDVRRVLSAEDAFDAQLPWPRMEGSPSRALLSAARRWSERVWESALEADPIRLDARDIERGLRMIEAPIFICGAHRSGTTLLRNLLDSHPAISMLPSEGTFFTNLEPFLRRQSIESWLHWMGREWLRRLANPINQAPYWLLGRTSEECSPYIGFARSLMAWWPLTSVRLCALSSWPITAVALAYAQCTRALAKTSSVARWGEKTPLNERFLPRLLTEFPLGQIIQLVRHPVDVYASRARLDPSLRKSKKNAKRVLEELAMSYRIGATPRSDRFRVIRYEDLVADTQGTMKDLAGFLGIEYDEGLLKPTVAGHLAQRNSSFALDPAPGDVLSGRVTVRDKILSDEDYALIASVTREAAAAFGYDV